MCRESGWSWWGDNWGWASPSLPSCLWLHQPFVLPSPPGQSGQACLLGPCVPGYDSQSSEGRDPGAASSKALGESVLGIFTDKRFCCGGKGQHWGSVGLGTWTRRKGEA